MRVLLHAWGSRGDVQPMIALGQALVRAGYEVALAAAQDFAETIGAAGLGYEPVAADLGTLATSPDGRAWLGGTARSPRQDLVLMGRFLAHAAGPLAEMLVRTHEHYDQVVTTAVLLEPTITLAAGRPVTCALLQPGLASRDSRSSLAAVRPGRSLLNLLAGLAGSVAVRTRLAGLTQAVCAQSGRRRLSWRQYAAAVTRAHYLVACSPLVTPPADDWRLDARVTGFWQLPAPSYQPEPGLARFLAAGERPVYLGFGSMTTVNEASTHRLLGQAVRLAGVRAVVHQGRAALDLDLPGVLTVGDVPHSWLFGQVTACVHHGGAGTTAAALTAGAAQVVVPHLGDQFYWGRRVHELGLGPAPLPRRQLTAKALAAALREGVRPGLADQARRLASQLQGENGAEVAVAALERVWAGGRVAG